MMAVLSVPTLALAAGCGLSPTETNKQTATETGSRYHEVVAEIEGLSQDDRWNRLIELAEKEEGTFQVYATISGDEIGPLMKNFRETVGSEKIDTDHYRAGTTTVLQRIREEDQADSVEADAIVAPGTAMEQLSKNGMLERFDTPIADNLVEGVVYPDWIGIYINLYTAAWNTELVSGSDAPTTWEEVLNYGKSQVGIEVKSYDWFATLVTKYFMEQQGLSEEEAIQLFMDASSNFGPVDGRSALTELVLAGQFDVAASIYTQNIDQFKAEGAPIDWQPPVEPLVQQPNGVAPMASSEMPATSLLFVDYLLSEPGQKVLAGFERIPTNVNVEGGAAVSEYDVVTVDVAEMVENREKWTDTYAQVTGEPAG